MLHKFSVPAFLVHLFGGLAMLWLYYSSAALRWEAIPLHAALVFCGFYGTLLIAKSLHHVLQSKISPLVAGVVSVGIIIGSSLWFVVQHITTFIGFMFWTDEVSFWQLSTYFTHIPVMAEQSGISLPAILLASSLTLLVTATAYGYWSRQLFKQFEATSQQSGSYLWRLVFLAATVLPLLTYAFLIHSGSFLSLRGEPFADAFRSVRVYDLRFKPTQHDILGHINARQEFISQIPENFAPRPVVLIMLDAARADHMSVYGYDRPTTPFLDSLFTAGVLHRTEFAVSPCSQSECGITGMLTSAFYPRVHQSSYKIHEALTDAGYNTHFLLSGDHSRMYPFMKRFYGDRLTTFRDGFDSERYPADDQVVLDFLRESLHASDPGPAQMYYLHLMSTHLIGAQYPEFEIFEPNNFQDQMAMMARGRFAPLTDKERELIINNYDNGMLQADDFIRRIFGLMDHYGILDSAIVVITADHGEGLGDGGIFGHAQHIHLSTINIPLLIYDATFAGDDIPETDFGSLIDIPTTVFPMLGLPTPASWEGYNLMLNNRRYTHHLSTFQGGNQSVIKRYESTYYMLDYSRNSGNVSVFNLNTDPEQEINIKEKVPDNVLEQLIKIYRREFRSPFSN
ncbi:MAG: sulfatase-like hydrolase/transferase [Balneolales bacterium]|nr:sulfatase-like hydrolase/transferase [Balneolales bacterium]